MGKLTGLIGAGVGLAVEISRSNTQSPASEPHHDLPIQNAQGSTPASNRIAPKFRRRISVSGHPDSNYDEYCETDFYEPTMRRSLRPSGTYETQFANDHRTNCSDDRTTYERSLAEGAHGETRRRCERQYSTSRDLTYYSEPPSYKNTIGSTKSSLHSYPSSMPITKKSCPSSEDSSMHKNDHKSNSKLDSTRNASLSSKSTSALQLPVIVPQRRPEDKSRGWMLCYAPMLEACDIPQVEFLDFLASFNEASKVCHPLFH